MIHWLVCSFDAHPDLAHGAAPEGLLSEEEQKRFAEFKVEKRRREWLLGRWTAKRLIRAVAGRASGGQIDLRALTIANDADGAPYVTDRDRAGPLDLSGLTLSISHRGDYAFCAVALRDRRGLGADIEKVEPLPDSFVADYLTPAEREIVRLASEQDRARVVIELWSAKEAALKALRLGLSVDTRAIEVGPQPPTALVGAGFKPAPTNSRWGLGAAANWIRFSLCCKMEYLPSAPQLAGWRRAFKDYVLTLVVADEGGEEEPDTAPVEELPA